MPPLTTWSDSLHLSYRLLPTSRRQRSDHLEVFLNFGDGSTKAELQQSLHFHSARSQPGRSGADPRRARDSKQLYETTCFLYEDANFRFRLTDLGIAVRRFLPIVTNSNAIVLARHAAFALSACQLKNPTETGRRYHMSVNVFPYRFVWIAMLALQGRISSDELNRSLFRVRNEIELLAAIEKIRIFRRTGNLDDLGDETVNGQHKNDRLIPVMSVAALGWTLILDKTESPVPGYYHIRPGYERLLEAAIAARWPHKDFSTVKDYVTHVANAACLPRDLR